MSTKYVLHGGSAQHINLENDLFFKEILKDTKNEVNILLVEFAGTLERTPLNIQIDRSQFERNKGNKKLSFVVAEPQFFPEQIKHADVIYIGGGTTVRLMETLNKYNNLKEFFSGKIVAGESAGANCLSSYCYSKSGGGVIKCLGLLPIKMISHYDGEHKEDIEAISEKLEILLLPNYQYKIFNN